MVKRENLPKDIAELEKKHQKAPLKYENIISKIENHKARTKKLKDRINHLKEEFEQSSKENRLENLTKISHRITEPGEKLKQAESSIGALEIRKFSVEQAIDTTQINIEAYKQGTYNKPLGEYLIEILLVQCLN